MATVATIGGNNNPVAGLPTPVLLALVGGGVGAVVLLRRKMSGGPSSGTPADQQTLLPNTAIMLGSLQQDLLQLSGDVGANQAQTNTNFQNLQSTVTGVGENIGSQIDALTAQQQQALTDLQNTLTNHYDANTATVLDAIKAQGDTLGAVMGADTNTLAAVDQQLAASLTSGFDLLTSQHNAELAGITALGGKVDQATGLVTGLSDSLDAQLSAINKQISGVQGSVNLANQALGAAPTNSWLSAFNGKYFLQDLGNHQGGGMIYVTGGRAYNVSWQDYVNATGKTAIDNQTSFWVNPTQYAPLQQASQGVMGTNAGASAMNGTNQGVAV